MEDSLSYKVWALQVYCDAIQPYEYTGDIPITY